MTLREKLIELAAQLPEDRLPAALAQMEQLASKPHPRVGTETIEFSVREQPRPLRLPPRLPPRASQLVMEVETLSTQAFALAEAFTTNARWWRDHSAAILAAYHDTYIAISQGEVFRGADYLDALRQAQAVHPTDAPFILSLSSI